MKYHVKPIYGNGWTDGAISIAEPDSFFCKLSISSGLYSGVIQCEDRNIDGATFEAKLRYKGNDKIFNCSIRKPDGKVIYGYCEIKESD